MNENLFRYMHANNMDAMILCRPDNVMYVADFETPISYGPADNCANGALSYVIADAQRKRITLIVADSVMPAENTSLFIDEVIPFGTMHFFLNENYPNNLYEIIDTELEKALRGAKQIAVEFLAAPWFMRKAIERHFQRKVIDAQFHLDQLRMIKQPYEIERLRNAAAALDAGHLEFMRLASQFHEGMTEYEVYFSVYHAISKMAGKVTLTGDLATGPRMGRLSGVTGPHDRVILRGDNGIFDTSIRLNGYWCDCANTVTFGADPSKDEKECFKIVREVYHAGLDALKPGNTLLSVDQTMKDTFERFDRKPTVYSGHHVGCNVNEPPRILCYDPNTVIEPNMVVCLEPQDYSGENNGIGVRLEHLILITDEGAEEINKFPWGFS